MLIVILCCNKSNDKRYNYNSPFLEKLNIVKMLDIIGFFYTVILVLIKSIYFHEQCKIFCFSKTQVKSIERSVERTTHAFSPALRFAYLYRINKS